MQTQDLTFESGAGYPVVHINNFLAYCNSAGYPAHRIQVKYEPRDIPQFGLKGLINFCVIKVIITFYNYKYHLRKIANYANAGIFALKNFHV